MASIKIKFRPSSINTQEGTIYYQITHRRMVRQIHTDHRLSLSDWTVIQRRLNRPVISQDALTPQQAEILLNMRRLHLIIQQQERCHASYTADDIVQAFRFRPAEQLWFQFMQQTIDHLHQIGKFRTSETYTATLRSFSTFRQNCDLLLNDLTSDLIQLYEAYLRHRGVTRNTSSFYMRILRAVYHRAVERDLIEPQNPFRHVYTGVDKTVKRALPLSAIHRLKQLDLTSSPYLTQARDLFLFSFYTRGMSFIDIAYLQKGNLHHGILHYRRRKTGQLLLIKWEPCMQDIATRYASSPSSPYLFNILTATPDGQLRQYRNTLARLNRHLKILAPMADIHQPLTLYCARHSWASIARSKHIPLSVISEGMGHHSETTTQIYLASLDNTQVDKANAYILKEL